MDAGYDAEKQEVQVVWEALVGDRDPGEDLLARNTHLASRSALLRVVLSRIADEQALIAEEIYRQIAETEGSTSYAKVAARLGSSRPRAQQRIERARKLREQRP